MPFVDSSELALILGEPHATVHRTLSSLLAEGIVLYRKRWHLVLSAAHTVRPCP